MVTQFLPIKGYPLYRITDSGLVISMRRKRAIRHSTDPKGYQRANLVREDGRQVCNYIHRLVAMAFLPNSEGLRDVDHIDGNPSNNNLSNLRWLAHADNMREAIKRHGGISWASGKTYSAKPICAIDPDTREIFRFASIRDAARWLSDAQVKNGGLPANIPGYVCNICNAYKGTRKGGIAYGYYWARRVTKKWLDMTAKMDAKIPAQAGSVAR